MRVKVKKKTVIFIIFLLILSSITMILHKQRQIYFCSMLEEEVSTNLTKRNLNLIPNWIKPFVNEELFLKEIIINNISLALKMDKSKLLDQSKCFFLYGLEKLANEYVSQKIEEGVVNEIQFKIDSFNF